MKAFTVTEISSGSWVSDSAVCTTWTTHTSRPDLELILRTKELLRCRPKRTTNSCKLITFCWYYFVLQKQSTVSTADRVPGRSADCGIHSPHSTHAPTGQAHDDAPGNELHSWTTSSRCTPGQRHNTTFVTGDELHSGTTSSRCTPGQRHNTTFVTGDELHSGTTSSHSTPGQRHNTTFVTGDELHSWTTSSRCTPGQHHNTTFVTGDELHSWTLWPKSIRIQSAGEIFGFPRLVYSPRYLPGGRRGHRLPSPSAEPFLHGTGTLWCLQKEMATYRHWSVFLWRVPDNVSHCRILSPDKTE